MSERFLCAIGKIIDLRSREEIIAQKAQAGAEIGKLSRLYMSGKITLEESNERAEAIRLKLPGL